MCKLLRGYSKAQVFCIMSSMYLIVQTWFHLEVDVCICVMLSWIMQYASICRCMIIIYRIQLVILCTMIMPKWQTKSWVRACVFLFYCYEYVVLPVLLLFFEPCSVVSQTGYIARGQTSSSLWTWTSRYLFYRLL